MTLHDMVGWVFGIFFAVSLLVGIVLVIYGSQHSDESVRTVSRPSKYEVSRYHEKTKHVVHRETVSSDELVKYSCGHQD